LNKISIPQKLRRSIPALRNKVYFNYGGQGPLPQESLVSIFKTWEKIQELGPFTKDVWPFISNEISRTKSLLASLYKVKPHQICLSENVTTGFVIALWGIDFKSQDRIIISDCEHPGIVAACKEIAKQKNLKIDILRIKDIRNDFLDQDRLSFKILNLVKEIITKETKAFIISHVLWNTGIEIPIRKIGEFLLKKQTPIYLLVDGAQSFGHINLQENINFTDIYAFTSHKWALGPEGLGGVILSERFLLKSTPSFVGWKSLKKEAGIYEEEINPYHNDARKFEIATSCTPLLSGLRSSLDIIQSEGSIEERNNYIKYLSRIFWENLNLNEYVFPILKEQPNNGIISFTLGNKESNLELFNALNKKNIFIRMLEDSNWLRACIHITSTEEEIKIISSEIKKMLSN
tara:strand:- start:17016 stop:18227 length:1212 start_codon:yes stop_codon:yes gene_type:complete